VTSTSHGSSAATTSAAVSSSVGAPDPAETGSALDDIRFDAIEVIGSELRQPGERVLMLLDVHNGSGSTIASSGDHPHRLSYRIFRATDGVEVAEGEPQRSRLASAVPPGGTRVSGLEVICPAESGDHLVVPTLVHEGIGWRDPVPSEGIRISIQD
jgi:hypothetical protein